MSHLPSLQTLRAFEAAGRLHSYTRAAAELGLTHGAVSHRIRELEQQRGGALFLRVGNAMHLTPDGQQLHAQVRQGLSVLEQAFAQPARADTRQIVITSVPSIAAGWLYQRLAAYRAENPGVEVELRVSEALNDYRKEGIDVGVRLGAGGWPGLHALKLFSEELIPVCTPAYRDRLDLRAPSDLARATLLRNPWTPWARWFRCAGLDWPEPTTGPKFDDGMLLLRSALDGDGVALGRRWLAVDALRTGQLVTPFPTTTLHDDFAYWLVWPTGRLRNPAAQTLRDWLVTQAALEVPAA